MQTHIMARQAACPACACMPTDSDLPCTHMGRRLVGLGAVLLPLAVAAESEGVRARVRGSSLMTGSTDPA